MSTDASPAGPAGLLDADGVEWWTAEQVREYLATVGKPIGASTWDSYVARGQAPKGKKIGAARLFDAAEIRAWNGERRGRGWRAATSDPGATS